LPNFGRPWFGLLRWKAAKAASDAPGLKGAPTGRALQTGGFARKGHPLGPLEIAGVPVLGKLTYFPIPIRRFQLNL